MMIVDDLKNLPILPQPVALTIGNFDGVHLGHQYLLKELKKEGTPVVLTFSNHSLEVLNPQSRYIQLSSLEEKLLAFEKQGIFCVIVLPFTLELAQTSYDVFIRNLHHYLSFSTLILGENARLGSKGEGDENQIKRLGQELNFKSIYLSKLKIDQIPVSSQRIRKLYAEGLKEEAKKLLNHF